MISMTRPLALGALVFAVATALCRADVTVPNCPAAYRLRNCAVEDPRTAGCGRCDPLPPYNRGFWLNNPRGTGMDDPWRPPKVWPQTRYPVVPAYTRPSYGFYETRWRVLPVCGTPPWTRTPPPPMPPLTEAMPTQRPAAATPSSTPAPTRNSPDSGPPRTVPPKATPPQATPQRRREALPAPTVPPADVPKTGQDEGPMELPIRAATAEPDGVNPNAGVNPNVGINSGVETRPEISVRAF